MINRPLFLLPQPPPFPPVGSHKSQCFSCSSAATEHCITLLKAFALKPQTRRQLVLRKLIQELVDFNLRSGSPQMQQKIRELLCIVSRDDETATAELNKYVSDRVLEHITPSRVTPTLVREPLDCLKFNIFFELSLPSTSGVHG